MERVCVFQVFKFGHLFRAHFISTDETVFFNSYLSVKISLHLSPRFQVFILVNDLGLILNGPIKRF